MRPRQPSPQPSFLRSRPGRGAVSAGAALLLLGGLLAGVPAAPAVAAPPVTVDRAGVGRTTTVTLGDAQLRPVHGRSRSVALDTAPFSMVAVTWRGPDPGAEVRTRQHGTWGPWRHLDPLADGPSPGSPELRGAPDGASQLIWVGDADGAQVRTARRHPRALRLVLIDPGRARADRRAEADGRADGRRDGAAVHGRARYTSMVAPGGGLRAVVPPADTKDRAPRPKLFQRRDWGADDSLRNGRPSYLNMIKQVHVHHTAGSNDYSRADVPRIIRGMYRYHTRTLGWFDLGYNFVVDRFGRAWVGRSGGYGRRVRGAHTLGFNHASVGIALIGRNRNWDRTRTRIMRLAAWKLDKEGRNADRIIRITSKGSDKYPAGLRVRLPAIDGHRDTNDTACPGRRLYDALPGLRLRAQRRIDRF